MKNETFNHFCHSFWREATQGSHPNPIPWYLQIWVTSSKLFDILQRGQHYNLWILVYIIGIGLIRDFLSITLFSLKHPPTNSFNKGNIASWSCFFVWLPSERAERNNDYSYINSYSWKQEAVSRIFSDFDYFIDGCLVIDLHTADLKSPRVHQSTEPMHLIKILVNST